MTGRVLVAGGSGRLGTLVVAALADRSVPVRVLTRDPRRTAHLAGPYVETVVGDIRDAACLLPAVSDVDVVVSAVQGFAGPRGVTPESVDRDGNVNLIDAARQVGADMVLMSVVGASPDSPMELFRMKHAAETALLASAVPATIVRATAFLELWIDLLRRMAGRSGRPLIPGRGQNPINFVSAGDVATLMVSVITDPAARGRTLEIRGRDNFTLDQLAAQLSEGSGNARPPRHIPRTVLRLVAGTVGRVRPDMRRQALAAMIMDQDDMTFPGEPITAFLHSSENEERMVD